MTKIFIAGHRGMVGSAICRQLRINDNDSDIITVNRDELDLTDQSQVASFFDNHKFDQVYLAAAKVGGIYANNSYPAEFIYQNLMIQNNVINSAYLTGVQKLLFIGSSCIYPREAPQPMSESALLTGSLEPTNEPYAIAKISGIKMCESYNKQYGVDYRSVMPTNLYGPGDNFHQENSHVIPALLSRFVKAKEFGDAYVKVWGSGNPRREFMHVDDMAAASIHVMNYDIRKYTLQLNSRHSHINLGTGEELSIRELVELISDLVGYEGKVFWDVQKKDGAPRKLVDSSKILELGWQP